MNTQELANTLNGNPPPEFMGGNQHEIATYQSEVYKNDQLKLQQQFDDDEEYMTDSDEDDNNLGGGGKKHECPICLKKLGASEKTRALPCFHVFHVNCIAQWENMGNKSCPLCRTPVSQ